VKAARWGLQEFASVVYGRTGDSTTAEQIKGGGRLDIKLVSMLHGFVGVTYERNRFAGIARRFEEYAGLALRVIDLPRTLWTFEGGSSINQQRNITDTDYNFTALRVATLFRHKFTEAAYFEQKAEVLPNMDLMDDLRANSETALVAPLSARVAIKLLYAVKFDNLPEAGFERTDRVFTTAVQIVF
jgi:putative salt-induced outer membrane protein